MTSRAWSIVYGCGWAVAAFCAGAAWVLDFRGIAVTFFACAVLAAVLAWRLWPRDEWRAVRIGWPYGDGWGTYNKRRRTVADSGLERWEAEERAAELNARERAGR